MLYVNDTKAALLKNCDLRLYAEDMCILYSHQSAKFIEGNLNYDFNNLCEWFIDKKLSIHFGGDKTKSILFKRGNKSNLSLNITQNEKVIKQHSVVKYLGCLLDENMSGEAMARMVLMSMSLKTKLQTTQNSCMKYCLGLKDRSHIR